MMTIRRMPARNRLQASSAYSEDTRRPRARARPVVYGDKEKWMAISTLEMTCMQHGPVTSPEAKIAVVISRDQPSNHVSVTVASDREE